MDIPSTDHIMRHINYQSAEKDDDGMPIGPSPESFILGESEIGLSVNWIEYFKNREYRDNIIASVQKFRQVRTVGKTHSFATANVEYMLEICSRYAGGDKIKVVHKPDRIHDNESHSEIIRVPKDQSLLVAAALANEAFSDWVLNTSIP